MCRAPRSPREAPPAAGFTVAVSILSRFCRGVKKERKEEDAIVEKGPKEKDAKSNNI